MLQAPSPNWDARPAGTPVDMLILHYTGMQSGPAALARLREEVLPRVSCHYLVEEDGRIFQLVPEAQRAWHAGISHWRGHSVLNGRSIGIEIVNPGHEWGYRPFPALQMAAVAELSLDILDRHPIPPRNVVAHSDIAPDRKQDPGELFDWQGLAKAGIGLWADLDGSSQAPAAADETLALLERLGFRTDLPLPLLLTAFQRHWRPEHLSGHCDQGTLRRLRGVLAMAESASA